MLTEYAICSAEREFTALAMMFWLIGSARLWVNYVRMTQLRAYLIVSSYRIRRDSSALLSV